MAHHHVDARSTRIHFESGKPTVNGGGVVSVSGNNASRVFVVDNGATVTPQCGLTIENGTTTTTVGGGILTDGT